MTQTENLLLSASSAPVASAPTMCIGLPGRSPVLESMPYST